MRDASPTVVLVPGVGMFSFGKNKTESRMTGEFYINAIGVMQGAGALGAGVKCTDIPQAGPAAAAEQFKTSANYVALPPSEAFRIEYWKLEEAKIRRQPGREGVEPKDCAGCRWWERDWARGRAAGGGARRACCDRGPRCEGRGGGCGGGEGDCG